MRIQVIRPDELDDELQARWNALRTTDDAYRTPMLTPAYVRLASAGRPRTRIAVIESDAGRADGFFPFESGPFGVGGPAGERLADYQGVVASPDLELDPRRLLAACGLRAWRFDHLVGCRRAFAPYVQVEASSPVARLHDGFAAYRACVGTRSDILRKAERQLAKLARTVGEVRLVQNDPDPAAMRALVAWKSAQYVSTGKFDSFRLAWFRDAVERMPSLSAPGCVGVLSTLYAGERPIAVHLMLRSETVMHSLLPAYDREFCAHSPGTLLLRLQLEALPALGVDTFDFGKGEMRYKTQLSNDRIPLAEGWLDDGVARAVRLGVQRGVGAVKRSEVLLSAARWARTRWETRGQPHSPSPSGVAMRPTAAGGTTFLS